MEIVEFRSARSDVFPAPTPTAGTLPSSLPVEVEAGGVAPEVEIETPVAPVALAWITWKEIGSDNAIKRFAGALALRTTPGFLFHISTTTVNRSVSNLPLYWTSQYTLAE